MKLGSSPSFHCGLLLLLLLLPPFGAAAAAGPMQAVPSHIAAQSPFAGAYLLNTTDPSVWPNSGAAMNLTEFALPHYPGKGFASFQVAVDELVNSTHLLVVGLEANWTLGGSTAYPFAAVLSIVTDQIVTFSTGNPAPVGALVQVALKGAPNGVWTAYVDGNPILNYSAGIGNVTTPSDTFVTMTSSTQGGTWAPSELYLPDTLEVLNGTHWYRPQDLYATWIGNGTAPLNISGELENASLFSGEFQAGTGIASNFRGAQTIELWNRTPILAATVSGAISPSPSVGGTLTNVSWRVTAQGRVLPGVRVRYWSSLGGPIGTALTNALGYANSTYPLPAVSSNTPVALIALVLNDSVFGSGNASEVILPSGTTTLAISLFDRVTVVNSTRIVYLVVTVTAKGKPAVGVALLLSAGIGGGEFDPFGPWITNAEGIAQGNYTVPVNATAVSLWVNASGPLYSGTATVDLTFPTTSTGTGPAPTNDNVLLLWAIGGGAAVGIAFNLGVWARRSRDGKLRAR